MTRSVMFEIPINMIFNVTSNNKNLLLNLDFWAVESYHDHFKCTINVLRKDFSQWDCNTQERYRASTNVQQLH